MRTNCGLKRYASQNIWARIKARRLEARRVAAWTRLSSCFCYGLHICLPWGASNRAKRSTLQPGNERFGQKRKCPGWRGTSVFPSGADIVSLPRHVRLVQTFAKRPRWAWLPPSLDDHPANSLPVRDSQLRRPTRRCRADRPIERSLNSRRACHRRWSGPARPWHRHWPNRH
jgi:hypothetical protein